VPKLIPPWRSTESYQTVVNRAQDNWVVHNITLGFVFVDFIYLEKCEKLAFPRHLLIFRNKRNVAKASLTKMSL